MRLVSTNTIVRLANQMTLVIVPDGGMPEGKESETRSKQGEPVSSPIHKGKFRKPPRHPIR